MNQIGEKTELLALLKLLDDPDPEIFSQVEGKVLEIGSTALPYLETAFRRSKDQLSNNRIKTILDKIQFNKTSAALYNWKTKTDQNLIEGSLILASFHYPELSIAEVQQKISKLKQDVWLELNEEFTALEKIHILNHVFFKIYNFRGNKTNLSQPQNSLINDLLDKRQGNSVILSILYLEIAQSLKLPVYGVNLPENFILAYLNSGQLSSDSNALFYINPFNDGVVFTKDDIDVFVKQLELEPDKKYFQPCHNEAALKRLMNELLNAYELAGDYDKGDDMKNLLKVLKG
jgi:regulator of sirC expression with transglutaminase-like and TPR domain